MEIKRECLHIIRDTNPISDSNIDSDGTETLIFSDTFFKEVRRPMDMFCARCFSAIHFDANVSVHPDDILYIFSRLSGFLEENPIHIEPIQNGLSFLITDSPEYYKDVVFNINNKKYKTTIIENSDGDRLAEDIHDLLLDLNEPIDNLNLQYEEVIN